MWKTEQSEETTASTESVWKILTDVEGWSSWNPGVVSAHLDGPLTQGARGRTKPAGGPEGDFTVVQLQEGRSFANEAKMAGARMRFLYRVEPVGAGRSRVTLGAAMTGPLSRLYALMFGKRIAANIPTAVKQLVAKAESGAGTTR